MVRGVRVVGMSGVALLATAAAIGCSSPTTSPSPSTSAGTGSAIITGTVEGSAARSLQPLQGVTATSPPVTVSVLGTSIAATVAPGESFTLNGIPTGNVTVQISGAGISAQVTIPAVQNQERIRVTVRVSDSGASITIAERTESASAGNQARVQGSITSINAPARTFVVDGVTVNVPANVPISNGDGSLAFTDLKIGDRVTVTGTFSGAALVATKVLVDDSDKEGDSHNDGHGDDRGDGHHR